MDKQAAKVVDNSVIGGISGASFGLGSSAVAATKVAAGTSLALPALTASLALHPVGWAIGLGLAGAALYGYLADES